MGNEEKPGGPGEAAAEAFARVLDAERAADEAVAACRRQAEGQLVAAHTMIGQLSERVAARVATWQERRSAALDGELADLERRTLQAGAPVELDATAMDRLAAAVVRLAAELTGDE
jgi:hypothetical protein